MTLLNGQISNSKLVVIEGQRMEAATSVAYKRMVSDADRQGVGVRLAGSFFKSGAYRDIAMQLDMYENPLKYGVAPGVNVARPGNSTHGFGTAIDIAYGSGLVWFIKHAIDYGFVREFGSKDPNHFRYTRPSFADTGIEIITEPSTPEEEELEVKNFMFYYKAAGQWQVLVGNSISGFETYVSLGNSFNNTYMDQLKVTYDAPAYMETSQPHIINISKSLALVRAGKES